MQSCTGSYSENVPADGSRVIIGVGNRVLLYDGNSGDLIESLRGDVNFSRHISCSVLSVL